MRCFINVLPRWGLLAFVSLTVNVNAQVTPSELSELSLQELMRLKISAPASSEAEHRWSFEYRYRRRHLDGFQSGTDELSLDEVLFTPPETRTQKNYPIAPKEVTQEIHTFRLGYRIRADLALGLTVPYIHQTTHHISIVDDFAEFDIATEGIGDIALTAAQTLPLPVNGVWQIQGGVSLPTGSIDEKDDTPKMGRGTQDQLPYTKQLGSGTFDLPLSLSYLGQRDRWHWGSQATALVRLGKNRRGYRLGNRYGANLWARYNTPWWVHPGIKFTYQYIDTINGIDTELLVPGPFPFPANITDPKNYGGHTLHGSLLLRVCNSRVHCKRSIDLEISKPLYLDLNGIQQHEDFQIGAGISLRF